MRELLVGTLMRSPVRMLWLASLLVLVGAAGWGHAEEGGAQYPPAKHVLDVTVEKEKEEDKVVISVDGSIEPKIFPFQGPHNMMVVVDIPGTTIRTKRNGIPVDGSCIKSVRIGQHKNPTKVRVVLDLLSEISYDVVEPELELGDPEHPTEIPTRLVVTIRKKKGKSP